MIYLSICTRDKHSKALLELMHYSKGLNTTLSNHANYVVAHNASSIYEGHSNNIKELEERASPPKDNDIIVLVHDDVEILSAPAKFSYLTSLAAKPGVGFVGVAGACNFTKNGSWWNARLSGEARGFVWQGDNEVTMTPNYFGPAGQVVVLDGCLIAATYKTLKDIGLSQPEYLSSGWDYYDIHMTFLAHYKGYANYVVPIMIRHESSGQMREGWYQAKNEFMRKWGVAIPCRLPVDKTQGLPI